MTSTTSTMTINSSGELYGQRTYQPGFDSVPDLIRYYVGGADDNAVLSYGGSNDGVASSSSGSCSNILSQPSHTEVRIRYPCNRRCPLMTFHTLNENSNPPLISKTTEHSRILRQHSHISGTTILLAEPFQLPSSIPIVPAETTSSLKHSYQKRRSPSPPSSHTYRKHILSSSFRSSLRRIPSTTITSTSSFRPSSAAESVTLGLPSDIRLQSLSNSSQSLLRTNSRASTLESFACSSITTPRSTVSPFSVSHSSTFGSSSPCSLNHTIYPPKVTVFNNKSPTLPESISRESSSLRTSDTSSKTVKSTELFRNLLKSNISVPEISGHVCAGSNVIDVDTEIAAELSLEDADDSHHNGVIHLLELPIIQSSFARVNLNKRHQSRNENCQIKSSSDQSGSRKYETRPESHQNSHENQFISAHYSGIITNCLDNDINVCHDRQKRQQQELQQYQKSSLTDLPASSLSILNAKALADGKQLIMVTEKPIQNIELSQRDTKKNLSNFEIELLVHKEHMDPTRGFIVEKQPLAPIENEDFEGWRKRWANLLRQRVVIARDQHFQECNQHNEQLQILKVKFEELQQRFLRENPGRVEVTSKETTTNRTIMTPAHNNVPHTRPDIASNTGQLPIADSEEKCTNNLEDASTEIMVENMILRWLGIQHDIDTHNIFSMMINNMINPEINFIQQQKWQFDRPSVVPHNHRSQIQDDESLLNPVTMKHPTIKLTGKSTVVPEIDFSDEPTNIGCQLFCDYENISLLKDNDCVDITENKRCLKDNSCFNDKYSSRHFKSCIQHNTTVGIDYENIVEETDYQNVDIARKNDCQEKKRNQMNSKGSSTAVVSALRAVHLTIVGNPDDSGGKKSAGTGRLAAALCCADGRATILPYRQYQSKCGKGDKKPVDSIISTCPLQLLSQPGLAGRRARLDIIER